MLNICGFEVDWSYCSLQWKGKKTNIFWQLFLWRHVCVFQDWGRDGDVAALGVCWHVPGKEEESFVFQLLSSLLKPELQRIKDHVSGEQPMSRCADGFLSCQFVSATRYTCSAASICVFMSTHIWMPAFPLWLAVKTIEVVSKELYRNNVIIQYLVLLFIIKHHNSNIILYY